MTCIRPNTFRPHSSPPFQTRRKQQAYHDYELTRSESDPSIYHSLKCCSSIRSKMLPNSNARINHGVHQLTSQKRFSLKRLAHSDNSGPATKRKSSHQKNWQPQEKVYIDPDGATGEQIFAKPSPLECLMRSCDRLARQHRQSPFSHIIQSTDSSSPKCASYAPTVPLKNPVLMGLLAGLPPLNALSCGPPNLINPTPPKGCSVHMCDQLPPHQPPNMNEHPPTQDLLSLILGLETARLFASIPLERRGFVEAAEGSSQVEGNDYFHDATTPLKMLPTSENFSDFLKHNGHKPDFLYASGQNKLDCDVCTQMRLLLATMNVWQMTLNWPLADQTTPSGVSTFLTSGGRTNCPLKESELLNNKTPRNPEQKSDSTDGTQNESGRCDSESVNETNWSPRLQQKAFRTAHSAKPCEKHHRNPPFSSVPESYDAGTHVKNQAKIDKANSTTHPLVSCISDSTDPPLLWSNLVRLLTSPSIPYP